MKILILASILSNPTPKEVGIVALELVPAVLIMGFVHESGHALGGMAVGMEIDRFAPYPNYNDCVDGLALGCVVVQPYDENKYKEMVFISSGIVSTRLAAEGVDFLNNRVNYARVNQFGAVVYLAFRFDSLDYIWRCALCSWFGKTTPEAYDTQALVSRMSGDRTKQNLIYAGLAAATIIDLILDWDEVKTNWNRLWLQ